MDAARVLKSVEGMKGDIVDALTELCKIPALCPEHGGQGEAEKFALLADMLNDLGFPKGRDYPSKDKRVPGGKRHNIVVRIKGDSGAKERIWIVSHVDVVPPGEPSLWKTDPYMPVVRGGRLYGRGTEDNGQAIVTSIFAAKALIDGDARPRKDVMLAFVSDEEVGSRHGIQHIIGEDLVRCEDLVVVPDAGSEDGRYIEVVEKSHLQLKLTVTGKQCHASRPHKGINAYRAASQYVVEATDTLYSKYGGRDELYEPPYSTFEPTKKQANVPNVNTIPGEDVSFFDYRILPGQDMECIMQDLKKLGARLSEKSGARFDIETVSMSEAAPATPADSPVVKALAASIKSVRGVSARPQGIGGGTCAAHFRQAGIPAAVWATIDETAHEPNEYATIKNMVSDAKVYAHLFMTA
ncbi:MAG: M20 family metallo-hydrolase [Methanobacteriota archaeon]